MNRRQFLPILAAPLVPMLPKASDPAAELAPKFKVVRITEIHRLPLTLAEDWKVSMDYPGFQTVCWRNATVTPKDTQ